MLGHAATWPQAAAALPPPPGTADFDWEGDRPLGLPMEDLVIYEMHVRGFTQGQASGVSAPGEPPRRRRMPAPGCCTRGAVLCGPDEAAACCDYGLQKSARMDGG